MKRNLLIIILYVFIIAVSVSFGKLAINLLYWKGSSYLVTQMAEGIKEKINPMKRSFVEQKQIELYAKTTKNGFSVIQEEKWRDFFVKGVNIGAALPGKWFTEFPEEEKLYFDWLTKIGEMKANTIRIYTLLPPEFYSALSYYNEIHPDEPLWLLQEIWPEEHPQGKDYLKEDYIKTYFQEIKYVVDAIHGNANIKEREGRAYGTYKKDVSKYVLGYLVGRELEPDEVISTNNNNPGFYYKGEYLSAEKDANPTEAWLAMNCDYVLTYEVNQYRMEHPVAIVSWPTLDTLEHDSEWNESGLKNIEYNDKATVDINHIRTEAKLNSGFFGAYHIYPNYPDFMNNERKYDHYRDEQGRFRYGGYLKEFIEKHTKYPALVAEFGLATGMGNAHASPDGYNHGGLTEKQQGEGVVRMMKAIAREGYAGGIIFEWLDEWAKKTWITEPYMIPYHRHALWHNAIDPEQNYGLLAMESDPSGNNEYTQKGKGSINKITLKHDAAFLYIDVQFDKMPDFNHNKLFIGLDTYDRNRGELRFTQDTKLKAPTGLEFLLHFSGIQKAKLLVQPGYNIAENKIASQTSSKGIFEEIRMKINNERIRKDGSQIPAQYQDGSSLRYGVYNGNSHNHWYTAGNTIYVRIPWGRLNFTDPSSLTVLDDKSDVTELVQDKLKTVKTEGILISALLWDYEKSEKIDMLNTRKPYRWEEWDTAEYEERLKKSYFIIQEYFNELQ
ncbi:MAG: hypothetical protein K0S71_169 [Clostridia bacterium]|jgi:hypothetical protein|nr:hypothetical protein [Clostridia bacterium]